MSVVLRILPLLAAVALAACGDSSEESTPTPSSVGSSASSATSNEQDAARVKLLQCVREQGIDVPDTDRTGEAFAQLSPADREKMEAALRGPCQQYQSEAFGESEAHPPDFLDALTKFTVCLRENGGRETASALAYRSPPPLRTRMEDSWRSTRSNEADYGSRSACR